MECPHMNTSTAREPLARAKVVAVVDADPRHLYDGALADTRQLTAFGFRFGP